MGFWSEWSPHFWHCNSRSPLYLFASLRGCRYDRGYGKNCFDCFYILALKKINTKFCFCKICITFIKNTRQCISHQNKILLFRYNQGKKSLPLLLPSQSMRRISNSTKTRFVLLQIKIRETINHDLNNCYREI